MFPTPQAPTPRSTEGLVLGQGPAQLQVLMFEALMVFSSSSSDPGVIRTP